MTLRDRIAKAIDAHNKEHPRLTLKQIIAALDGVKKPVEQAFREHME